mgnify:CR=1 FL=1
MNNPKDKITFIKELADQITLDIIKDIQNGKIPETWDGIELRWLFALRSDSNFGSLQKKRKREFKNTVIVNGL